MKKRICSILLMLCLMAALLPRTVQAYSYRWESDGVHADTEQALREAMEDGMQRIIVDAPITLTKDLEGYRAYGAVQGGSRLTLNAPLTVPAGITLDLRSDLTDGIGLYLRSNLILDGDLILETEKKPEVYMERSRITGSGTIIGYPQVFSGFDGNAVIFNEEKTAVVGSTPVVYYGIDSTVTAPKEWPERVVSGRELRITADRWNEVQDLSQYNQISVINTPMPEGESMHLRGNLHLGSLTMEEPWYDVSQGVRPEIVTIPCASRLVLEPNCNLEIDQLRVVNCDITLERGAKLTMSGGTPLLLSSGTGEDGGSRLWIQEGATMSGVLNFLEPNNAALVEGMLDAEVIKGSGELTITGSYREDMVLDHFEGHYRTGYMARNLVRDKDVELVRMGPGKFGAVVSNVTAGTHSFQVVACDGAFSWEESFLAMRNGDYQLCFSTDTHTLTAKYLGELGDVRFDDVPEDAWYYDEVTTAAQLGLINGMGNGKFQPNTNITRGMLVTLLYRMAGEPATTGKNPFEDVASGRYYTDAVKWASKEKIVNGMTATTFQPETPITREQMATMLHRFARYCEMPGTQVGQDDRKAMQEQFPDAGKVSGYAQDAFAWAIRVGLMNGMKDGATTYLNPRFTATRAQAAAVMIRLVQ